METQHHDAQTLISSVLKKLIIVLGPSITLAKARTVAGLQITDDGTVTQMTGDPKVIGKALVDSFLELSTLVVHKTMQPLLEYLLVLDSPQVPAPTQNPPAPAVPTKESTQSIS